jgi:ADP-ribose pyrophosphatase
VTLGTPPDRSADPGFRHLGDRPLHRGAIWQAVIGTFEGPDGIRFEREIVRTRGAVASVPVLYADDDTDRRRPLVRLIAQYRATLDEIVIEAPAGMRDVDGEEDIDNARRELVEEVGVAAGHLAPLVTIYPSPGMTDATLAIFLATDCTTVERTAQGPEEAHSQVLTVPLDDAIDWILDGTIRNATTIIGLLLTERVLRGRGARPSGAPP